MLKNAGKSTFYSRFAGPSYVSLEIGDKEDADIIKKSEKLLSSLDNELKNVSDNWKAKKLLHQKILIIVEQLQDIKLKLEGLTKFGKTKYTASFGCFVKKDKASEVTSAIDAATNGNCAFEINEVSGNDKAPTLLDNPKLVKPFEFLTKNYGLPAYNSFDPTFLLAAAFVALFGIMFADLGYGIVLSALSIITYLATRKTTKVLRDINAVLFYCGLSSAFFGLLFGEFFGGFIEIKPVLFNPADDVVNMLGISLVIGVVHVSAGLISGLKQRFVRNLSILTGLWSVVLLAFSKQSVFGYVLLSAIIILFFSRRFYFLKDILNVSTHTFSYLRIGVLSIVHIIIARLLVDAVSKLPGNAAGIAGGAILLAIGAALSIVTGVLIAFIQSLRLQWLELFSEFEFGGREFNAFGHTKEYLYY